MPYGSRRSFFGTAAGFAAAKGRARAAGQEAALYPRTISLNGEWEFSLDQKTWRTVTVPHTWQTEPETANHLGKAWYRHRLDPFPEWKEGAIRIEFESVFHSARVFVNSRAAGEHIGKGYTAFTVNVTSLVDFEGNNTLTVEVDNSFQDAMLPRNNSYDWTPDGGIYRPVWLHVTPAVFIERVEIDAVPDLGDGSAEAAIRAVVCNLGSKTARLLLEAEVCEEESGRLVAKNSTSTEIPGGRTETVVLPKAQISRAKLWHFDHPHLYRVHLSAGAHSVEESFGIRKFEVRGPAFYLNGERVWLMGVERMAGSHPQYGMAEPLSWIEHDHGDMKELNCVFTRVHWMQDRRLLDWCDRHGMLIQLEVPTWGPGTFKGMQDSPAEAILNNGLEQLRELISQNRNHPCVFAWGLCNEIGGQNPPAKKFAQAMFREARKLDPSRPLSYASNTLHSHTADDVAGEMDFLEWNEYYESWYKGSAESVREALAKIRARYPNKPIVISEYGLCECDPKNPTSDERRIEILKSHNAVYRSEPNVGGLIFFCYNDYRTHMGDKGLGIFRQRVHGVVDLYGNRKPSYEVLRQESSPVETLALTRAGQRWQAALQTRSTIPCHTLEGYQLRFTLYGFGGLPMEQTLVPVPTLKPGGRFEAAAEFRETKPVKLVVEMVRPTGSTVLTAVWKS
ncbi:MAG: family 1 glycosylhydrolase [Acidobacteria bacterium]|nr:family 1 glycosylhydrolase [Acidobacteriota bacterium]